MPVPSLHSLAVAMARLPGLQSVTAPAGITACMLVHAAINDNSDDAEDYANVSAPLNICAVEYQQLHQEVKVA